MLYFTAHTTTVSLQQHLKALRTVNDVVTELQLFSTRNSLLTHLGLLL
jgi:hypothetical protein